MRPLWNQLLLPCFGHDCCCDSVEAQELGLLVVGHPWGDGCLRLPDPLGFFGFAALDVVGDDVLRGYDLLEV